MMVLFLSLSAVFVIGTVAAREADVDINRIHLLPQGHYYSDSSSHERRSISGSYQARSHDYDDHSGRFGGVSLPPLPPHLPKIEPKSTQAPLKVHQPREDPRFFYQSDAYLEKISGRNINHEVTFVYPGREVIRAADHNSRPIPLRVEDRDNNFVNTAAGSNKCIRCPRDRTLVARARSDRVQLQTPRLFTCSGHRAPRNFRFVHMYGPKFGSLLEHGSHLIIGKIMLMNKGIHLCKMQVNVIIQSCTTPRYLQSNCEGNNCSFTCRNPKHDLYGQTSLTCGNDMKWIGEPPICRARTWCEHPTPPEHGRVSCKSSLVTNGIRLSDGSKCRVRCQKGWRWHPRAVTVCRRGTWTNALACQKTKRK